jgi:hypothetical protein
LGGVELRELIEDVVGVWLERFEKSVDFTQQVESECRIRKAERKK